MTDEIFKCIFWNEKFDIFIRIPLMFVPEGPINKPSLVQVMASNQSNDKLLSETI